MSERDRPEEPIEEIEWPEDGPPPVLGEPFRWFTIDPPAEHPYDLPGGDPTGSAGLWWALTGTRPASQSSPASS